MLHVDTNAGHGTVVPEATTEKEFAAKWELPTGLGVTVERETIAEREVATGRDEVTGREMDTG